MISAIMRAKIIKSRRYHDNITDVHISGSGAVVTNCCNASVRKNIKKNYLYCSSCGKKVIGFKKIYLPA